MNITSASRNLMRELKKSKQADYFNYNTTLDNPIVIGLTDDNAEAVALIPKEYEGYEVTYKIIGKIIPLKK